MPKPTLMRISCELNDKHYKAPVFIDRIKKNDLKIRKVACSMNLTTILTMDGHVYGAGQFKLAEMTKPPNNPYGGYNNPFDKKEDEKDPNDQETGLVKLELPIDCVDIIKISCSPTSRILLTSQGQVFCQGENLRHYLDPEIKRTEITAEFVNCTEVFPIDSGDQIIDVAAGKFMTIVVTDGGHAYAAGHDSYRSRESHNRYTNQVINQEYMPAYKIEHTGQALKCWASTNSSICFLLVEQEDGTR